MNEQLQGKLVEILSGIQTATKAAGDFAMEQLPDIAQSYVMYGRVLYSIAIVFGAICLVAGVTLLVLSHRSSGARINAGLKWVSDNKPGVPSSDAVFALGLAGTAVGALGFAVAAANVSSALLVWFAPKVWLLKELAGLIK